MREIWKWTVLCDEVRKTRSELLPSTINRSKNLLQTPSWKTIEQALLFNLEINATNYFELQPDDWL